MIEGVDSRESDLAISRTDAHYAVNYAREGARASAAICAPRST